jgi:hypothetical protein
MALFRKRERTDLAMEDDAFIEKLARLLERKLKPLKPGSKAGDK